MGFKKNITARAKGSFRRGQEEGRQKIKTKKRIDKERAQDAYEKGYYRPSKSVKKLGEISVAAQDKFHKTGKLIKKTAKILKPIGKAIYDIAEKATRPPTQNTRNRQYSRDTGRNGPPQRHASIFDDDDFDDSKIRWRKSSQFYDDDPSEGEEYRYFGSPFGEKRGSDSERSHYKRKEKQVISYPSASTILDVGLKRGKGNAPQIIGDIPYQSYGGSRGDVSAILNMGISKTPRQPQRQRAYTSPKLMDIAPSRASGSIESIMNIGLKPVKRTKK